LRAAQSPFKRISKEYIQFAMDNRFFGVFLALFGGVWLYFLLRDVVRVFERGHRGNWFVVLMGVLVFVGAIGFFGASLAAVGFLKLPNSFEWPVGNVCGVKSTADGKHVVPLEPSGRVQIYDANWHFLRGWHVGAHGGGFQVECPASGGVEVYTGRGQHHYSFTEEGELVSATTYRDWPPLDSGSCLIVPTSLPGWIFSSPFFSWGTVLLGGIGLWVFKKLKSRKSG
jgi:hypothetical protein